MSKVLFKSCIAIFLLTFSFHNIMAQFANGADIGWLSEMEAKGYIFKNDSGIQKNCLEILKEHGINSLRFRVWVNPAKGYCNKIDVTYMAKRADSMGFKVMLDFHYSDYWADPGKQTKPAAWKNHSTSQLLTDIYNFTYEVVDTLKSVGVVPAWVQIGNETNDGMLWEDGRASIHMNNFTAMIKSGYDAVKAVDSSIQVIVHLSNAHDLPMYRWMFDGLKQNGAKWDIIGMSVYPYWAGLPWQTDNEKSLVTMKDMISRYKTKVMVVETGYLYNQPDTAYVFLVDLLRKTKSVGGLGVFYWEPESYDWANYQLGAWDPLTQKPTKAMDAFLDTVTTSIKGTDKIPEYGFDIYPNPFNPVTTIEYKLPESTNISINIYNLLGQKLTQLIDSYQNAGTHSITWNAVNIPAGVFFCSIKTENFSETKKIILLK